MKNRIQINLSEEARSLIESVKEEANTNFESGNIGFSDVINEMVLCSQVNVKALQMKHINLTRTLRLMASKDMDIDTVIKNLNEIKAKMGKRKISNAGDEESKSQ